MKTLPTLITCLLLATSLGCSSEALPPATEPDAAAAGLDAATDASVADASVDDPDAASADAEEPGPDAADPADAAAQAPDAGEPDVGAGPDASSAFNFAVMTDVHIGEGRSNYNGEDYDVTDRIAASVARINAMAAAEKLEYVFILGDLTRGATDPEYARAKALFEALQVPYFPLLGNHDVWPYSDAMEAPAATGDATFVQLFEHRFAGVEHDFARYWNPEQSTWSRFIDFEVRHGDVVLLGLDWNTRQHALPTYQGALPEADLHDFEGGTIRWLKDRLAKLPATTKKVIFLQHHPFRSAAPVPAAAFTFTSAEGAAFRAALSAAPPLSRYFGVLAGHSHRDYHGTAFDEWNWFEQHEFKAAKETGEVAIVRVSEDGAVTVETGR